MVPLPGHTRGHCGVAVETSDGWLLHCGDAYDHKDELAEGRRPSVGIRLFQRVAHADRLSAEAQIGRINQAVEAGGGAVTVFATH